MGGVGSTPAAAPPILTELIPPVLGDAPAVLFSGGRPTPPWQVVYHYDHVEWELFIREWATSLVPQYEQIKRLGGANDHGVDVAAFKTRDGFEGEWDCFQGKHYSRPLVESDVLPEMLKIFLSVARGHYLLPKTYRFLSTQGCAGSLEKLLSSPAKLKLRFLAKILPGERLARGLSEVEVAKIQGIAASTDFAMFDSVQFEDVLTAHRLTPYHAIRFGEPLAPRPPAIGPPAGVLEAEAVYVQQLVQVYMEKYPDSGVTAATLIEHEGASTHFQRQRVFFYRAEALRKFAESSVPQGAFDDFQNDVFYGVVDAAEKPHPTAFARLSEVLSMSVSLQLSQHLLMTRSDNRDLKGICHQLANDSRLFWAQEGQS